MFIAQNIEESVVWPAAVARGRLIRRWSERFQNFERRAQILVERKSWGYGIDKG